MQNIAYLITLYAVIALLAEFAYLKGINSMATRKTTHIVGGVIAASFPYLLTLQQTLILGAILTLILFISQRFLIFKSIHEGSKHTLGEVLYPLAITISALLFWPVDPLIFQAAVLALGFSDGLAALFGSYHGDKILPFTQSKTLEGSSIFFVITYIIFLIVLTIIDDLTYLNLVLIFAGSVTATILEAISKKGWDNLFVPLATGATLVLIF